MRCDKLVHHMARDGACVPWVAITRDACKLCTNQKILNAYVFVCR